MMEAAVGVKKPPAVLLLQIFGAGFLAISVIPLAIGAIVRYDELGRISFLAIFPALAGVCALVAGWRRPLGLVFGMVALSLMLVTLIGAVLVAIVGFLGARDKEQVRAYYAGAGR